MEIGDRVVCMVSGVPGRDNKNLHPDRLSNAGLWCVQMMGDCIMLRIVHGDWRR